MPIRWHELKDSREIQDTANPSAELLFRATGSTSETDVLTEAYTETPATFLGLTRDKIHLRPDGWQQWLVSCSYNLREIDDAETWDTSGGTQHIKTSLATVDSYCIPGFDPPDFKQAIQCDGQRVGGTDITVPVFNYTRTKTFPKSIITDAVKLAFYAATGKTNNAALHGFNEGEVLLLGASGSQRGREKYQITCRYAASPNLSGLSIGEITGIEKAGWDFLWVYFVDDISENTLVKIPYAAFVERVYQSHNLSVLGF